MEGRLYKCLVRLTLMSFPPRRLDPPLAVGASIGERTMVMNGLLVSPPNLTIVKVVVIHQQRALIRTTLHFKEANG